MKINNNKKEKDKGSKVVSIFVFLFGLKKSALFYKNF